MEQSTRQKSFAWKNSKTLFNSRGGGKKEEKNKEKKPNTKS